MTSKKQAGHRRGFLATCAGVGLTLPWCPPSGWAQPATGLTGRGAELMTPGAKEAIRDGLAYLASRQNEDGSFGVTVTYGRNVGVCALAGLAFLSQGSTPGRGSYGQHTSRCIDFILSSSPESDFIVAAGGRSHGPMYGHGFATLVLAEVYGMSRRTDVRKRLARAVRLIIDTQNREGGWRYQPQREDADVSVTICQVMALRAARNAGIYVPHETVDHCTEYIKRCQNEDGGFRYMMTPGPSEFARSAAGVVALYSAGIYDGNEVNNGLAYLMKHLPGGGRFGHSNHFFYGHYYAVQAMWHAGGDRWSQWYPAIRDTLLESQQDDGSWTLSSISPEYGTTMALIVLQMPNNYLPIFQR